jgi:uncharacterized protein involved in type VI secretion and phage assembly
MDILSQILAPPAANRFYGLSIGLVTNNQDPENLGRVKVRFPWLSDQNESYWARVVTPMAGNDRGLYCLPEVNDEVLVAFEHGVVEFPYVLGALWNGKDRPPETNADGQNNRRVLKSRSGHIIRLDDTEGEEKIEIIDKTAQNRFVINVQENSITIAAQSNITIQAEGGKLSLNAQTIEMNAETAAKVTAGQIMQLTAGPEMIIQGELVKIN